MASAPLADLRIIAIEQFGAGPWATMQLADLGAEVVKIEDPTTGGDVARHVPPYAGGGSSLYFESFNRGKRSLALDLRDPAGRATFERLVGAADAVFSNLRGDKAAKLGITFEGLREHNPKIVCCTLTGFGATGPRATEGAYDHVIQGLAGWMSLTGEPDGEPQRSGIPMVDFAAGYACALTLLAAVHRARREGVGGDCEVTLFEAALSLLAYIGTWTASRDYTPVRRADSAHQTIVPFQTFAAADGWVVIACPKQHLWERLCVAIERPDLLEDERFADFAGRDQNRDACLAELGGELAKRPVEEWVRVLSAAEVPVGTVNDVAGALGDPQAIAREMVVSYEHPELGEVRQVRSPLRVSGHDEPLRPGPALGADTAAVLAEWCGITAEKEPT